MQLINRLGKTHPPKGHKIKSVFQIYSMSYYKHSIRAEKFRRDVQFFLLLSSLLYFILIFIYFRKRNEIRNGSMKGISEWGAILLHRPLQPNHTFFKNDLNTLEDFGTIDCFLEYKSKKCNRHQFIGTAQVPLPFQSANTVICSKVKSRNKALNVARG